MGNNKDNFGVAAVLCLLLAGCGGGGGGTASGSDSGTSSVVASGQSGGESFEEMGGTGQVTVAWTSDPTNVDGTCTAGIQAYRINVGLTPGVYLVSETVPLNQLNCTNISASACGAIQRCSYTIEGLTAATWYISIQTVDVFGSYSDYSQAVAATVY